MKDSGVTVMKAYSKLFRKKPVETPDICTNYNFYYLSFKKQFQETTHFFKNNSTFAQRLLLNR